MMGVDIVWLSTATMGDVITLARRNHLSRFDTALRGMAETHLSYAAKTSHPTASRIATECGSRCRAFASELAHGRPFVTDDLAGRVELFGIACKVLDIPATYRQAIAAREGSAANTAAPLSRLPEPRDDIPKPFNEVD